MISLFLNVFRNISYVYVYQIKMPWCPILVWCHASAVIVCVCNSVQEAKLKKCLMVYECITRKTVDEIIITCLIFDLCIK